MSHPHQKPTKTDESDSHIGHVKPMRWQQRLGDSFQSLRARGDHHDDHAAHQECSPDRYPDFKLSLGLTHD